MASETIKTGKLYRNFQVKRDQIDADTRTVELAFSSETPAQQWFGTELLDHSPKSVRMARLQSGGAPLLLNHDPDDQIGVIESASIDSDRVGRAVVRFSKAEQADQIFQDVVDGIRTCVSVGYVVNRMLLEESADDGDTYRVIDWEPYEISIVSIPADPTVGVGRSATQGERDTVIERPDTAPAAPAPATAPAEPATSEHTETPDTSNPPTERIQVMEHNDAARTGREAEQKRTQDLLALADNYSQFGARDMVADYIRNGRTPDQFKDALMEKIVARHSDAREVNIGMSNAEVRQYSLIRAVQATLNGDWSQAGLERAASEAVAKRMGKTPEGFYIPVDAFSRSFAVANANEAGNVVQTTVLGNEFVDVLRNKLILSKLGIRFLGGLTSNIAIPKKAATANIQSLAENAAVTPSTVNTSQLQLTPHRVSGQVTYTKQALQQASIDVEAMLRDDMTQTTAVQIENLVINGTGATSQPRGLLNTAGIGAVIGGANGAQMTWAQVVALETACANANSEPDERAGYAINTKTRGWLKSTQKGVNLPMIWADGNQPLNGYRAAVSNNLPSNGTKGTSNGVCSTGIFGSDWSDLILGMFGGFDVVVDPYTQAKTGEVVITCNQFIDVAVRQVASFSAMVDILTQ